VCCTLHLSEVLVELAQHGLRLGHVHALALRRAHGLLQLGGAVVRGRLHRGPQRRGDLLEAPPPLLQLHEPQLRAHHAHALAHRLLDHALQLGGVVGAGAVHRTLQPRRRVAAAALARHQGLARRDQRQLRLHVGRVDALAPRGFQRRRQVRAVAHARVEQRLLELRAATVLPPLFVLHETGGVGG